METFHKRIGIFQRAPFVGWFCHGLLARTRQAAGEIFLNSFGGSGAVREMEQRGDETGN